LRRYIGEDATVVVGATSSDGFLVIAGLKVGYILRVVGRAMCEFPCDIVTGAGTVTVMAFPGAAVETTNTVAISRLHAKPDGLLMPTCTLNGRADVLTARSFSIRCGGGADS